MIINECYEHAEIENITILQQYTTEMHTIFTIHNFCQVTWSCLTVLVNFPFNVHRKIESQNGVGQDISTTWDNDFTHYNLSFRNENRNIA